MCSPSAPAQQTVSASELPEWAKPYAQETLAKGQALTGQQYQTYNAPRIAGFTPLQQQAQAQAAGMAPAEQLGTATSLAQAAGIGALGAGGYQPGQFYGGTFGGRQAAQYMNPFLEMSLAPQIAEAQRQAGIAATQQAGQAVKSGAFGGSRYGLQEAELQRNLGQNISNIVGQGYNQAFQQAQQQFNQDMARRMQAQQLGEQSRQFGAGLGLQGLQTGLQAAGQLGQLGQTQYGQEMGINQLQQQVGAQQQALQQQGLSQAYQDFLNQQNYPYKQLGFMSDLIRGLPLGQQSTQQVYQAPPTALQTVGSLGLGAYGLKQLGMFAEGGSVTGEEFVQNALSKLSDTQLAQAERVAIMTNDQQRLQDIAEEKATRASERGGMAGAFNSLSPAMQQRLMAGGGIVAFAGDENENDEQTGQLVGGEVPSEGNPNIYQQALQDTLKYAKEVGAFEGKSLTQDELNKIIQNRYALEQRLAGPSPYGQFEKYIAEAEAARPQALQEAKGLGALRAMQAITQPGGFIRGLGGAGAAFGETLGKAKEADRAEKRALASMQLNLADAQRKERMGMTKSAIDAATQAQKDQREANKAHIEKLKAQGLIAGRAAQAARPTAQKGAGQPKFDMTLFNSNLSNLLQTNQPKEGESPKAFQARMQAEAGKITASQLKTTDVGPQRAGLMAGQTFASASAAVQKAVQSQALFDDEYKEGLASGDPDKQAAALDRLTRAQMKRQGVTPPGAGGGSPFIATTPALPPGFQPVR